MIVKELVAKLLAVDQHLEIMLASDPEGNSYLSLTDLSQAAFNSVHPTEKKPSPKNKVQTKLILWP